jgi:mono/diheme cytochrome c family protein
MPLREYRARRQGYAWDLASEAERRVSKNHERRYEALMTAWRKANPDWDRRLTRGEELYTQHCLSCHGETGRGNGIAAPWLIVRPRDFTRGMYRYRSTPVGKKPLDGDLFRNIQRGLPGTAMPSWRQLSEESIWLLVDYLKSLFETVDGERGEPFDDEAMRVAVPELPPLAVADYDLAVRRGEAVYQALKCSNCHGSTGRGDGPGWASIKNNGGLIRPRDLKPRHEGDQPDLRLRGGATAVDLYRTIYTGLDGTGMPAHLSEIRTAMEQGRRVAALRAAGAPQAEIDAAAKEARRNLFQSLKDPVLLSDEIGVKAGTDENGNYFEYLEALRPTVWDPTKRGVEFGDDWALVLFVLDLMKSDPQAMAWPKMVTEED